MDIRHRSTRSPRTGTWVVVIALFWSATGHAQVAEPSANGRPSTTTLQTGTADAALSPLPPRLELPAADSVLVTHAVRLTWRPAPGGLAPTRYEICVVERSAACSSAAALVYRSVEDAARLSSGARPPVTVGTPITRTQFDVVLPPLLQGKALQWTVSACAPGRIQVMGQPVRESCASSPPRALRWDLTPPQLIGVRVTREPHRPTFEWSTVPAADYYLFCVSRPGVACATQPIDNGTTFVVAIDRFSPTYTPPTVPVLGRFAGQTVHWTVAACSAAAGCRFQPHVAGLALPPAPEAWLPRLLMPDTGTRVYGRRVALHWQSATSAVSHAICLAPPGVACGNPGTLVITNVQAPSGGNSMMPVNVPASLLPERSETPMNWTVGACDANARCIYAPADRRITFDTVPTLRIAAIGDSVMWGQGLADSQKYTSRVIEQLRARAPSLRLDVTRRAHSGAIIGPGQVSPYPPLPGEVPASFPTVFEQLLSIPDPASLDLLLVNGCINDINVRTILNPLGPEKAALRNIIGTTCHEMMKGLLMYASEIAPQATIVVTGYFPIVSPDSGLDAMAAALIATGTTAAIAASAPPALSAAATALTQPTPAGVAAWGLFTAWLADQTDEILLRSQYFYDTSTAALQRAVADVAAVRGTRQQIVYLSPGFRAANAMFGARAMIHGVSLPTLGPVDDGHGVAAARRRDCDDAARRNLPDFQYATCVIASAGHPNALGAEQYSMVIAGYLLNPTPERPNGVNLNPVAP